MACSKEETIQGEEMKKKRLQTVPLWPETDEIVERRKMKTGLPKQIIVNRLILSAAKKWEPQEQKP